jgi:signal transduction histidine kinase/ActR/RegA family two-component response regulator
MDPETLRLAVALGDAADRSAAAQRLAAHVGAAALIILIEDAAVNAYVPANGFLTLPGGAGWRELLARARVPGLHRGVVAFLAAENLQPTLAYAGSGIMLVFIGGTPDAHTIAELERVAPLLASMLRAEHEAAAARGEQRAALDHAREVGALAGALDAARSDLERTLRELEDRSRALDQAREHAERAVRAKDEFLAVLGHELRNPLSPIMTAIQLLRLKGQTGREYDVIARQVVNVIRLVDDLLDVSRLTSGKIVLRREPTELADVAARAVEMVSPLLERKRQILAVDIPPHGLVVDADPTRLTQVLANLLNNAAKYSDEERRVVLSATGDDTHVRIRIKDDGIGIPQAMLDRIFDPFAQQPQALDRSQGGLGLGLAIVRSLVRLHDGTVRAHSEGEGRGAEFVVELPRVDARRPTSTDSAMCASDVVRVSNAARVLIVDDHEDARTLLAEALTAVGYEVKTACDGPDALAAAPLFNPDIAILDIGLPVMDGYELASRLRASTATDLPRLVAVTGYGQEADRRRAHMAGFDAHLVKPLALDDLLQVLAPLARRADVGTPSRTAPRVGSTSPLVSGDGPSEPERQT